MDYELQEARDVISALNEKLYKKKWNKPGFTIIYNGFQLLVSIFAIVIYDSDNSNLDYVDKHGKDNVYSLEEFCIIEFNKLQRQIMQISI